MRSTVFKGYLFTILATLSFSNVYVFSKAALNELPLPHFLFLMYSLGFVINLSILISRQGLGSLKQVIQLGWKVFIILGLLEIFTVSTFYASVNAIAEPAVAGFLGNLFPLFTTIMGIIFLHERFSRLESIGIVIVFAGSLLTSYSGQINWQNFFIPGIGLVIINCLGAATATVIVRAKVNNLSPELLSMNRTVWLLLFFTGWVLLDGSPIHVTPKALLNTSISTILDPVLAILLVYKAYQYIEASRGTIIQSARGLIIVPVAFLYFGTLPLAHQLVGGVASIIGVGIMAYGQRRLSLQEKLK